MRDPTSRFTNRVERYALWRPTYPETLIDLLAGRGVLSPSDIVADVGSGTGRLTDLLLRNGNRVFGVEPNEAMRLAGERALAGHPRFTSLDGRAEATGLGSGSVDVVTAGQAFHWFDQEPARREFLRILRPGGRLVLVWNDRSSDATPFMAAYEALLQRHGTDYAEVRHRSRDEERIHAFFGPGGCDAARLDHHQDLDLEGLEGRLLSSSYVPEEGSAACDAMLRDLREIFESFGGRRSVRFVYDTKVYFGPLGAAGRPREERR